MLLGALSLSPYQVAGLYQAAASGFVMPLRAIEGVTDQHGQTLSRLMALRASRFLRLRRCNGCNGAHAGGGAGHGQRLAVLPQPIAAKTGTSNDQRDAWFMGFDDRYLGVVWVGRDDNEPMPWVGGSAALPIWAQTLHASVSNPCRQAKSLAFCEGG